MTYPPALIFRQAGALRHNAFIFLYRKHRKHHAEHDAIPRHAQHADRESFTAQIRCFVIFVTPLFPLTAV
jgi:hypothetical protein